MISQQLQTNTRIFCPCCNKTLDGATGEAHAIPKQGDLSVCIYCATPLIFQGKGMNLQLVEMSKEFLDELKIKDFDTWNMIQRYIYTIKEL